MQASDLREAKLREPIRGPAGPGARWRSPSWPPSRVTWMPSGSSTCVTTTTCTATASASSEEQHEAEDVTHQVFVKLISAIHRYEPRTVPFTAWILRVARNVAIDHLRQRRAVPCEEVSEASRHVDESGRDRRWGIEVALEALPEDQRDVVLLRHLVGLTPGAIAARAMSASSGCPRS